MRANAEQLKSIKSEHSLLNNQKLSGYPMFFDSSPNIITRQPNAQNTVSVMENARKRYEKELDNCNKLRCQENQAVKDIVRLDQRLSEQEKALLKSQKKTYKHIWLGQMRERDE